MPASASRSRWTAIEAVALTASCLLLLWLNRGEYGRPPHLGALFSPTVSFAAAVAVTCLVPGWVLCRLLRLDRQASGARTSAFACGLGIAWLAVPATAVLVAGGRIDVLAGAVAASNSALVLVFLAWRRRSPDEPGRPPALPVSPWLAAAAAVALWRLLALSARWPRFSFGSDEWILMRSVRYFLEARPITYTWDFDVWDLVIALVIRLARVDLLDAYRVYLPPLLIVAASLAFLALAEALFRDRNAACVAYVLLALYALSDMKTRGDGAGMALVVRIAEDKHAALVVLVPVAQAALLAFARGGPPALLAVSAATAVTAVVVYPLALVWLAVSVGAAYVAASVTRRMPARPRVAAAVAVTLAAAAAVAWWLRSQRAAPYFRLYDPEWPAGEVLRTFARRKLLIFSTQHEWYMAHPSLLQHPLMIAGLVSTLLLLPRFRRSLRAQFLVCATVLPLLLVYNPLTASWLGAWIAPWMVPRVLWIVPTALALGCLLHAGLVRLQRRLPGGAAPGPARGRFALLWLLALGGIAAALAPQREASWRALKARNRVAVYPGERDLMQTVSADPGLGGQVLAPWGIGTRLPAWTSRLRPYPALDDLRWSSPAQLADWKAFYAASAVGEAEVDLLRRRRIDYVITRTGTPIDLALRGHPAPFKPVYGGVSYSLYAWRPERWPGVDTSFDTAGRNLARSLP